MIPELLKESGLTRQQFADMLGVNVKTTYWPEPPKYAITVLEQYIALKKCREFRNTLRRFIE